MGKKARQQRSEQKKAARDLGFSYEKLAEIVGRTVEQVKRDASKAYARCFFVVHVEYRRVLDALVESVKSFDIAKFMAEEREEEIPGWDPGVGGTRVTRVFTYKERAREELSSTG